MISTIRHTFGQKYMKIYCNSETFWYMQKKGLILLTINAEDGAKGILDDIRVFIKND